ncbi:MAG: DNA-protecting protein DprA [Actinobacteria bacterium]|nr:DNA-protecting protein DprA [Actinomycetota bacterium]
MLTEADCRLVLFTCIEPADPFWSAQISDHGAQAVYHYITSKNHYSEKNSLPIIREKLNKTNLLKVRTEIENSNSVFITPRDLDWPIGVDDLPNPPIGLLLKGNRKILDTLRSSISIVGSRKPTSYGVSSAKYLATQAAKADFTVVSGGAHGIDTAAHISTLSLGKKTICILAGGFNHLYPVENLKLFDQITRKGLLISEVMPSVSSQPFRFLVRNRLIAAISRATVVIEAEYVSGSIRTARDAAEIFRPVFAVPGEISSPLSEGCHRLISERVADIATSFDEILELITPIH